MSAGGRSFCSRALMTSLIAVLVCAPSFGQENRKDLRAFIASLLYPSNNERLPSLGVFDCGSWARHESDHIALVSYIIRFGEMAIFDIETMVIEALGKDQPRPDPSGLRSVLVGYSRIRGSLGTSFLGRVEELSTPVANSSLTVSLNEAWAAAYGVAAVIGTNDSCFRKISCSREDGPKDVLSSVICGLWNNNDGLVAAYVKDGRGQDLLLPIFNSGSNRSTPTRLGFRFSVDDLANLQGIHGAYASSSEAEYDSRSEGVATIETAFINSEGEVCGSADLDFVGLLTQSWKPSQIGLTGRSVKDLASVLISCGLDAK